MTVRLEGWEDRLGAAIARHAALPFAWGVSDCGILLFDAVLALTGEAVGARDYDSAEGAAAQLAARGCTTLSEALGQDFASVHPAFARRGDIGTADYPGALLGGGVIVLGAEIVAKGERGLVRLRRERLVSAFKVGW